MLPPIVRILAEAAQRYGMIVRDQSGAVSLLLKTRRRWATTRITGPTGCSTTSARPCHALLPLDYLQVVQPAKVTG